MFTVIFVSILLLVTYVAFRKRRLRKLQRNSKKDEYIQKNLHPKFIPKQDLKKRRIFFRKDLPFEPNYKQIIYIETVSNPNINKYIQEHYDTIKDSFEYKGFSFFYLSNFDVKIKEDSFLNYNFPDITFTKKQLSTIKLNYSDLFSYLSTDSGITNGLIRYEGKEDSTFCFSFYELTETELQKQFDDYILKNNSERFLFQRCGPEKNDIAADFYFDMHSKVLIDEIQERIAQLRIMGIEELFLKSLLEHKPKLSKMLITKDFRIILPDYNKEIFMHPLPKAVYFLFLKHPNGILFKELTDYKNELLSIYKKITARNEMNDVMVSINDITDPTKNAINEKCSRIRGAFVKEFNPSLAQPYLITGKRGEPKKIELDRKLVHFEFDL